MTTSAAGEAGPAAGHNASAACTCVDRADLGTDNTGCLKHDPAAVPTSIEKGPPCLACGAPAWITTNRPGMVENVHHECAGLTPGVAEKCKVPGCGWWSFGEGCPDHGDQQ